ASNNAGTTPIHDSFLIDMTVLLTRERLAHACCLEHEACRALRAQNSKKIAARPPGFRHVPARRAESVYGARVTIPKALTIAGVDPSGGAGILADTKTFSALGAYGCAVIAALTAQNTRSVTGIHAVPPEFVRLQLDTLFADVRIDAAKIGMLGTAPIARAVADGLAQPIASGALPHLVVDPVMVAKSGDVLLTAEASAMLIEAILPLATVITPNLPEAGALLSRTAPATLAEMRSAAQALRKLMAADGERWVLVKGGHLSGEPVDVLHDGDRLLELPAPRIATRNTHGTGCTLSAAIAALLPQHAAVPDAIAAAKRYLSSAIAHADALEVGSSEGHGPVHHFWQLWSSAALDR
ncbi:MAG TPA: bifunctional hydroxymethylpyrimidine kinase/phosphomethylpyrimidine kinase, partial [Polyangiales bacterium]|nr:bifunctional hydroxymethylpyrimidine kinase/phosphomethylpyrimidine kinase [Polyangiales bacterium]